MRSKFGGAGEDEEEEDEVEKRAIEENEPRTKHSIDGILGDRCKLRFYNLKAFCPPNNSDKINLEGESSDPDGFLTWELFCIN